MTGMMHERGRCSLVVLCLLVLLVSLVYGQQLKVGMSCAGEKKDLCGPSMVCEDNTCRLVLGGTPCENSLHCKSGLTCARYRQVCVFAPGADCSQHRDMCDNNYYTCDASNVCRRKAGVSCPHTSSVICSAGAECVKESAGRYGRKCRCIPGVSTQDLYICKPVAGKILGACVNGTSCDDPYGICNTTSQICQCGPNTTMDPTTLSCDLNAGQSCAGTKKRLCVAGTTCGDDQICRVLGGLRCAGDKKNLCEDGTLCIDDKCMADFGEINIKGRAYCRPGSTFANDVCWKDIGESCKTVKKWCYSRVFKGGRYHPGHCDPWTDTCRLLINSSRCIAHSECPPGSLCVSWKCQCTYSGQSFAVNKNRVCGLPQGKVGAQCRTDDSDAGCDDPNAKCRDKNNVCICKSGYTEDVNRATCVLSGRKCTLYGRGAINPFFETEMPVVLPCRYKLADFRCGGVKVQVYASKGMSTVAGVTVHLKRKTSQYSFNITADKLVSSGSWTKTCLTDQCPDDKRLETSVSSGLAVVQRDLFKLTYRTGYVHIECGHTKFKGRESYPDVLCGSPTDTESVVSDLKTETELDAKTNMADTFQLMPAQAFKTRRLTDRAVLIKQKVSQSNPLCEEASKLVSRRCPSRVESMYNCSHVIDDDPFLGRFSGYGSAIKKYTTCFGDTIDPLKVYMSCLRVMCDRNATDVSRDTCRTLQEAADRCDADVGRNTVRWWDRPSPFTKMTDVLDTFSRCPKSATAA